MQFPAHGFGLDASRPVHILQLGLTHSSCVRMCTFTVAMPEVWSHSDDSHMHATAPCSWSACARSQTHPRNVAFI